MIHNSMPHGVSQQVVTQNPRDFTVQIRDADDVPVGTGVAVSMAGDIVTCAHVVKAALGAHPRDADGAEVAVYFPQVRGGETKARTARIAACFRDYDDDIVLLHLTDGPTPLGPEQIAQIGAADASFMHPFLSYGYPLLPGRTHTYQAAFAKGEILGCVECPTGRRLHAEPVQLQSQQIKGGMSGAPVLDTVRNLVIGVIAESYYPAGEAKHRDTGWAVDAQVLAFDPLNLPLAEVARPKQAAPAPPDLPDPRIALLRPTDPIALHGAPPLLEAWVGRDDLLTALTADWRDPATTITALVGFGGEGKSSLARKWLSNVMRDDVMRDDVIRDDVIRDTSSSTHESRFTHHGIFWWSFYDAPSAEACFEALLAYLGGGGIDPRRVPSASAQMKLAARMLRGGRYVLILDGFEVMQHQEGDDYGMLRSADLRAFLEYLAAPGHETFTVITSRAPLLDLLPYTTATQRDVTRLSAADGRALLRVLGVQGPSQALARVVRAWDGHALTLSLLGGLLAERHDGDIRHLDDLPTPTADEDRYARVHRVLRRYDEHLTEAERDFLKVFSAFRTPMKRTSIGKVFRRKPGFLARLFGRSGTLILDLTDREFDALIQRLVDYGILKHDPRADTYTAHPLIRNHYFALFTQGDLARTKATHARIQEVYLELAGDTPRTPSLDDLRPLIEVVHHACRAGAYDEAWDIYWQRVLQGNRFVLPNVLGAWEAEINALHEFFPRTAYASEAGPAPDLTADPQVSDPKRKSWILNEVGLCLMCLGRLREAVPFFERGNDIALEMDDWHNASAGYQNLASLYIYLGDPSVGGSTGSPQASGQVPSVGGSTGSPQASGQGPSVGGSTGSPQASGQGLDAGAAAARVALRLARQAENQQDERNSLAYLAWAEHLRGDTPAALEHFAQAEAPEKEIDSRKQYLYSNLGIFHAEALIRAATPPSPPESGGEGGRGDEGGLAYARRITEANLEVWVREYKWPKDESACYRVLGDIDAFENHHTDARAHYDEALRIARAITFRPALIEALIARGRHVGKAHVTSAEAPTELLHALDQAFADLREALDLATRGGYRIYETDARVALAWAYLATPIPGPSPTCGGRERAMARALEEAQRARALSEAMGYYWGQVDAEEVLGRIENEE